MPSETTGATGLAGRYAKALFELADADKLLDRVADDLRLLATMIGESADLRRVIGSPVISRADQGRAMGRLAEQTGLSDLTRRFVGMVAGNRRLYALPQMIDAFLDRVAARRGEAAADVISAAPLTGPQLDAIIQGLKQAVGSAVAVKTKVDPALVGGLIVKVGSRMVDSSLRTKLQRLRLAMKGVG